MKRQKFTVTKEHIKLLKHMYTSWYDCEYGAPCIDPKRPYGNGSVEEDMIEILGIKTKIKDGEISEVTSNYVEKLHKEMETVLQILVRNAGIKVGTYQTSDEYEVDWKLVK